MSTMREDARRVLTARRERVFTTPAPLAAPLVWAFCTMATVAVVLVLLGVGAATMALALSAVAAVGAVAARRTLASLLAGMALLLIRPYRPGEQVRLDAPEHGGEIDAEVLRLGLVNTTLRTDDEALVVANTRLLRATAR